MDCPSSSASKKARHSIANPEESSSANRRRGSFLNLHIPDTNWKGSLTHLHLPSFTLTSPDGDQTRRFTFGLGLRRHSHNVSSVSYEDGCRLLLDCIMTTY